MEGPGKPGPEGNSRVLGGPPLEGDVRFQSVRMAPNLAGQERNQSARLHDSVEMVPGYNVGHDFLVGVQVPSCGESSWRVCGGEKTWKITEVK